jgi:hypothetical protein
LNFKVNITQLYYGDKNLIDRYNNLDVKFKNIDILVINSQPLSVQYNNKNAKHFYFQRISYNIFSEFSEKNISTFNAIKSMLKNDPGKQALNRVKSRIVNLTGSCKGSNLNKVFDMVNFFSPYLFKNMEDYIKYIFSISHRSTYGILAASRLVDEADQEIKTGAAFKFKNVVLKRAINHNNKKIVLFGLCQDWIFNSIKQNLNSQFVERLNAFLKKADFKDLDDNNFKLTKILIELNKATGTYDVDQFALDLQEFYLNKIYSRRTGQKVVNKKKMYGFLISIPGSSPRQALYQLSKMNKMKDIGFLIKKFPELSKLAMFV